MAKKSLTVDEIKALKPGETLSETVSGRGSGTLLFIRGDNSTKAYYRYTAPDKKRPWVPIGVFGPRFTLANARSECIELWTLRKSHPYLAEHLESIAEEQKAQIEAERIQQERESKTATLSDLLDDYIDDMKSKGRESADHVAQILKSKVKDAHPAIMNKKAKDILPDDIRDILTPIAKSGAMVYRNRVRSYLHSAFSYGIKMEYDETRTSEKTFGLVMNPVAAIPAKTEEESTGTRALTDSELKTVYDKISDVAGIGLIVAEFLRFLIATAGQRPTQVLRVPWADYDLVEGYFKIKDIKGRKGDVRVHLVPLTTRAITALERVKPYTGGYQWPFCITGKKPLSSHSFKNIPTRFFESEFKNDIERFTIRDLRRTCKQLMTRSGMTQESKNLLQNHGQTGVDKKSYDNDPFAFLSTKKRAMQAYERALSGVLDGKKKSKVVKLKQ